MMALVKLSASDSGLVGKYGQADFVVVECDATNAAFTVYLPSYNSPGRTMFVFVKTDSSSNAVTIASKDNEDIDGASSVSLTGQYHDAQIMPGVSEWHRGSQGFLR